MHISNQPTLPISNAEFLREVFGDDWPYAFVTSGDPKISPPSKWTGWTAAEGVPEDPTADNFFCISTFDRAADGEARCHTPLFRACHVLVFDGVGPKIMPDAILPKIGRPSYGIETSPGSEQWGYILAPPITHRRHVAQLLNGMVAKGVPLSVINPGMAGITRLVRLPVGSNTEVFHAPTL